MADRATIARPYAVAAFRFASESSGIDAWDQALARAAAAVDSDQVDGLIGDPRLDRERLAGLVSQVGGPAQGFDNFIAMLTERGRLRLLDEIGAQFRQLRQAAENRAEVRVTTASELSDDERQRLIDAIGRRSQRQANISTDVDPSLIGGAVIRIGDQVIDGSVRGRLSQLAARLQ